MPTLASSYARPHPLRRGLRSAALLLVVAAVQSFGMSIAVAADSAGSTKTAQRPNIVFILADDKYGGVEPEMLNAPGNRMFVGRAAVI